MNTIFTRVSIRQFEDRAVEPEKIEQILKAAMQAPSAGNQQPWEFIVVTDKETLKALSKVSPYAGPMANAPCAIVNVCNMDNCRFPECASTDMAIATEHEWLEATDLGLGGVWLGIYPLEDRMNACQDVLHLEGNRSVFSLLPIRYPAQTRKPEDRFHPERITYR